jgi:hypothetical protein
MMSIASRLISKGKLKIVGSTLTKKSPRDFDVVLVLEDKVFKKYFGITAQRFLVEGKTGLWSKQRRLWAKTSVLVGMIVEERILTALSNFPLDLKIIPKSIDKKAGGRR